MIINAILLFLAAMGAGTMALWFPTIKESRYKLTLVFAGSYLFAVTIVHILPELFSQAEDVYNVGLFVLLGFFLQMILEYFTAGVEHGHVHKHSHNHSHGATASLSVLIALSLHALLEGAMVAHPTGGHGHVHHENSSLLVGILLHKAPAAFALVSILTCQLKSKQKALLFLSCFALASPVGLLTGHYYVSNNLLSTKAFEILFALVSGNFLHISTTIVFEGSVDHHFNAKKLGVAILGASVALAAQYLF